MNTLKFLLCLVLFTYSFTMHFNEFENLLGKHISVTEKAIGNDFDNKLFGDEFYYIEDEFIKKDFYGMSYNCVSITTNEKDIVQSISVHFRKVIPREFYDSFIKKYGEPNNIQIIENRQVISEGMNKDPNFKAYLKKSTFDLREGTFEEKPLYIIWKKEQFQIKAFLRHKQNISEITFRIPTDKF